VTFVPDLEYPVPPHPTWHILDNSKLACYKACPRRFFYSYILGWGSKRKSVHLIWGEGVHRMLAHCYRNGWSDVAMKEAVNLAVDYYRETFDPIEDADHAPKTAAQFEVILQAYANKYVEHQDFSVLHSEVGFKMKILNDLTIAGRIDLVVQYSDSSIGLIDFKTAGRMPSEAGANQWYMSSQIRTYLSALRRKYPDHDVGQASIRLIVPYKPRADGTAKKTALLDLPVSLDDAQLLLWEKETVNWVAKMADDYRSLSRAGQGEDTDFFPGNTNSCFDYARLCTYFDQCSVWLNPLDHIDVEGIPEGKHEAFWDPTKEKAEEVWNLT